MIYLSKFDKETCPVCCLLNRLLAASRKYTILDFAMFKTCIFSAGAMIGLVLAKTKSSFKSKITVFLTAIFAISYIYIFIKTFFLLKDED